MITPRQIKAARALLGWSQQDLADKAILAFNTVRRIEAGQNDPRKSSMDRIHTTLAAAGIEFSHDGDEGVRRAFQEKTVKS
ncbi:MAG TPA: helix-turn-helix domain-containing protein [Arenibaculum sp.]|nr:helix-turn-helix domain-containing protein [Arenibaculum sp.]